MSDQPAIVQSLTADDSPQGHAAVTPAGVAAPAVPTTAPVPPATDVATPAPIAGTPAPVPADVIRRPWVRRDVSTGLFVSRNPAGADPDVVAACEAFEADLVAALGSAAGVGRLAIARQATVAYGIVARLTRQVERYGVATKAGRLRAALKALETWQSRLVELLALLGLDKRAPVDAMAALREHMERSR